MKSADKKFITVHDKYNLRDNTIHINSKYIIDIYSAEGKGSTVIYLVSGSCFYVEETVEEVMKLLSQIEEDS